MVLASTYEQANTHKGIQDAQVYVATHATLASGTARAAPATYSRVHTDADYTAKAVGPEGEVSQDHITLTPRRPKPKGREGGNTLTNGQRPRQRWLCARHQAELAKCPYVGRSALSYMRAAKWTWDAVSWRPTRNQRMATTAASAAVC